MRNQKKIILKYCAVTLGITLLVLFKSETSQAFSCNTCADTSPNFYMSVNIVKDPIGINIPQARYERNDVFMSLGGKGKFGLSWGFINASLPYNGYILTGQSETSTSTVTGAEVNIEDNKTVCADSSGTGYICQNVQDKLVQSGSNWIFNDEDNTTYQFDLSSGRLSDIIYTNGIRIKINYRAGTNYGAAIYDSITSNIGYGFKYFLGSNGQVNVYAANTSAHSCDSFMNCNGYDGQISINYVSNPASPSGMVTQITDAGGANWQYYESQNFEYQLNGQLFPFLQNTLQYFKSPEGSYVKTNYNNQYQVSSVETPQGVFGFTYPTMSNGYYVLHPEKARYVTATDPQGNKIYSAWFNLGGGVSQYEPYTNNSSSTQVSILNEVINQYVSSISLSYGRPKTETYPEGNKKTYNYNSRNNITQTTENPKSGSGQAATNIYASYPSSCTNPTTCNKPTSTTDAKGNTTNYTYDGTHGGLLTTTLPADAGGIRQRTYNVYTPYDTGDGIIYRLTKTEICGLNSSQLSLGACPALNTTSVTTTTYLGKTFQPQTITQTDGANSQSATTTYTYDNVGNVTVVDGPRTDVDDRVYKTYDANRRVIFEIGADPDGGGVLKRAIVKHTYNGDGNEIKTEYGSGNATDGSDFAVTNFKRMTYDTSGRLAKTEEVLP